MPAILCRCGCCAGFQGLPVPDIGSGHATANPGGFGERDPCRRSATRRNSNCACTAGCASPRDWRYCADGRPQALAPVSAAVSQRQLLRWHYQRCGTALPGACAWHRCTVHTRQSTATDTRQSFIPRPRQRLTCRMRSQAPAADAQTRLATGTATRRSPVTAGRRIDHTGLAVGFLRRL